MNSDKPESKKKFNIKDLKEFIVALISGFAIGFVVVTVLAYLGFPPKEKPIGLLPIFFNNSIELKRGGDVYLVIYSDYGCPFCSKFYTETLQYIMSKYNVTVLYHDFPIPELHGINPFYTAQLVRCVYKYEPELVNITMYRLYSERLEWLGLDYTNLSRYLFNFSYGPNHNKIVDCYFMNDTSYYVYYDYMTAKSLGLLGTPTMFIVAKNVKNVDEIKNELEKYGLKINIVKDEYNGKWYYIIPLMGALPKEVFDYIFSKVS